MTGWQWHQLDHVQKIICTSLQTDNTPVPPHSVFTGGCRSCHCAWCVLLWCCVALVCDSSDSQPHEARRRCVLDFDMFHHLVALCFSLPALYADDDSASADKQLLVATGGLNDLHALQLVFTAHVVQLLLAACVNLKSEGNNLFIIRFFTPRTISTAIFQVSLGSWFPFEFLFPVVLWRCWLGGRKSIRTAKKLSGEVLSWLSVWSGVQIICIWSSWCNCHPIISCSNKIHKGLPFWCRLTQVVLEKRLLSGFNSSICCSERAQQQPV